jgi:phenylalanyl-tRNA synthetase beta chain
MVAGVVSGRHLDRWGQPQGEPLNFEDAKGYVEHILASLGLTGTYEAAEEYALVPGRTAVVSVSGEKVGLFGQIHPEVARAWDIDQEVYLFEVSLEALLPHVGGVRRYRPISRFPAVIEDLAVIVEDDTPSGRVRSVIESVPLVKAATLFDVYTGQPIPDGKKSLAYSVSYQAEDHTLTVGEVERERKRIIERLRHEFSAELRQ